MGETYHTPPIVLISDGLKTQEHRFQLVADSPESDLVLESRVGLFGELVRRCYQIHPPLPQSIRENPESFLEMLAHSLKIQNFEKDQDLWIFSLRMHRGDLQLPPFIRQESLPLWEKMLHGIWDSSRMAFDLTPPTSVDKSVNFYQVDMPVN